MPKVTVYIRNDDFELWRNLEHKTEFISASLRGNAPPVDERVVAYYSASPIEVITTAAQENSTELCVHGAAQGFCKYQKCKYSMFNPKNRLAAEAAVAMDANQAGGLDTTKVNKSNNSWKEKHGRSNSRRTRRPN